MGKQKNKTSVAVVVSSLKKKAKPLFKKLPDTITTKQQFEDAAFNMKAIKAIGKQAEAEKASIIDPIKAGIVKIKASIERIEAFFSPFEEEITITEAKLKTLMAGYLGAAKTKVGAIGAALDSGKIKKASTAVRKQNELIPTSNVRHVWQAVEVDVSKTPAKYLIPDEAKIKEDLKAGKKIPGWVWKQVEQIVI